MITNAQGGAADHWKQLGSEWPRGGLTRYHPARVRAQNRAKMTQELADDACACAMRVRAEGATRARLQPLACLREAHSEGRGAHSRGTLVVALYT